MTPICDMHLPVEVEMKKIPGRTTFELRAFGNGQFYFDDIYQCPSCKRYYHQKLGYIHAPTQQNNHKTQICPCGPKLFHQMAVTKVGDAPDTVILGCVICNQTTDPMPMKDAFVVP